MDGKILIKKAEKDITKILKQLEIDISALVDDVRIIDVDVTSLQDGDRSMYSRSVQISIKRNPGSNWS